MPTVLRTPWTVADDIALANLPDEVRELAERYAEHRAGSRLEDADDPKNEDSLRSAESALEEASDALRSAKWAFEALERRVRK